MSRNSKSQPGSLRLLFAAVIREHPESRPAEDSMSLRIHQFACLSDNYGFLLRDEPSGRTACVDTPDAQVILGELERLGWSLDLILNTHWHPDHAGGNAAVKAATGALIVAPAEVAKLSAIDRIVSDGDVVTLGETPFTVLDVGGHTAGHIAYYSDRQQTLFAGDTLFTMGCGRLFEGTPQQMWASLQRLAALPAETVVYCAHEYTLANARFALSVDDAPAVAERAEQMRRLRERGAFTVPTTIGEERATNPFLRAPLLPIAGQAADAASAFAIVRAAKDAFKS
jgi:hydroxyacylglutathione hydrolase